jgi:hypothetical protein
MKKLTYKQRLAIYEQKKAEIAATSKSSAEYERRIKALVKELKI